MVGLWAVLGYRPAMHSEPVAPVVTPLPKTFGAVVTQVRLAELDEASFAALSDAWLAYGLLIFPGQHFSDAEQVAFAKRFGPLVEGIEAAELSNIRSDGSLRDAPGDDMMKIIRGNMHWHQDNTYMPVQAKGAVFSAKVVPPSQGDTAFADLRAAWAALDDATQARLASLSAYHSLAHSQRLLGEETKSEGRVHRLWAGCGDGPVETAREASPGNRYAESGRGSPCVRDSGFVRGRIGSAARRFDPFCRRRGRSGLPAPLDAG